MSKALGKKLRKARENLGISQGELARGVGLSSEFISLLEIGKRRPSLETLTSLSKYLKKDISYLLEEDEFTGFEKLLKIEGLERKDREHLKRFHKFCLEYLWLEKVTDTPLALAPLYSNISPERLAREERQRLGLGGLGEEPIRDVFNLIEFNGLHVIRQALPETMNISGVFVYLEDEQSAFALINSSQPYGLQVLTAAHEYYHFLKDRFGGPIIDNPDVLVDEYLPLYHPREKFAHTFAMRFILPPEKVLEVIEKDIQQKYLNFKEVLYLKRYFGISTLPMLYMLRELDFLSSPKFKEYQKLDAVHHEKSIFGFSTEQDYPKGKRRGILLTDRFTRLAYTAYEKKKINKEKLSRLLKKKLERTS
jgi:transcriptional regulator with XRE-family HTH domain